MTTEPASATPDPTFGRDLDDEDHDLLTYNESNARLRQEIAALDIRLNGSVDPETRAKLEERRDLMRRTLEHHERRAVTDQNASGFLGYAGPGTTQA